MLQAARRFTTVIGALLVVSSMAAASASQAYARTPPRQASASLAEVTDPVIAAAGDIACDPADSNFNGGNGTLKKCHMKAVSDLLVAGNYAAVLAAGDEQYDCAGYSAFLQSYDPSWGRVNAVTHPAIGNHEYQTSGGTDCSTGGAGYQQYYTSKGVGIGTAGQFWYSFDVGTWHLIALNTNCSQVGCKAGSPQDQWLQADLAAHPNTCTLAFWHQSRFASGNGHLVNYSGMAALWNDLAAAHADVAITGHHHLYERLSKMDANGVASATGVREWVVGTGGKSLARNGGSTVYPTREFFDSQDYGFLELTLHSASYDWRFIKDNGTVLDSGSDTCTA